MKVRSSIIIFNLIVSMLATCPVWAGSQQTSELHLSIDELTELTKKVENTMAAKGARVFIIGRNGRPAEELPPGVKYTHVSFGIYSMIKTDDGRTIPSYAYYNLYQKDDNPAKSKLVIDYTIDFLAGLYEPKVGIVIPTPELQKRLLSFIGTHSYESLHVPEYSVMANQYNSKYQNCTEFVLDVINASIYKTTNKKELKNNAKEHFEAQEIKLAPFKIFLGSIFIPGVNSSDHTGKIKTATFTTIANYMARFNLSQEIITIKL